jgi:hypothetical protein
MRPGGRVGAGAGIPIEAAAPNLVLTAPRRALYSPTSQLTTILKVLHTFNFRDLGVNKVKQGLPRDFIFSANR